MPSYTQGNGEDTQPRTVLPKGRYQFRVEDATETKSKAGNDMIELKIKAGDEDTGTTMVWEYLVFSAAAAWKIDQFRLAIGQELVEGETISIEADDLIGAEGTLELKVGKNNKGDDRNEVVAFIANEPF